MATKYRDMTEEEFLTKLSERETDLIRVRLPQWTRLTKDSSRFLQVMKSLGGLPVGSYVPDLSELQAPGLIAPTIYLPWARLDGARLNGADLGGANLSRANLNGADLERANLNGADLDGAGLGLASLDGASLMGASLYEASLGGANLSRANLNGADLERAGLEGTRLENVLGLTTGQLIYSILRDIRVGDDRKVRKIVKKAYQLQGERLFAR